MEQYAVVYFPKIDTDQIQALREKYDPHWKSVPPHITLVSPFVDIPEEQILGQLRKVTKDMQPFDIQLHGLLKTDDRLLFLLVEEGRDEVVKLHASLYSGVLASLVQEYTFNPHMTLGELDTKDTQKAYAEAKGMSFDIHTIFDSISLIKGDVMSPARIVKTFHLK